MRDHFSNRPTLSSDTGVSNVRSSASPQVYHGLLPPGCGKNKTLAMSNLQPGQRAKPTYWEHALGRVDPLPFLMPVKSVGNIVPNCVSSAQHISGLLFTSIANLFSVQCGVPHHVIDKGGTRFSHVAFNMHNIILIMQHFTHGIDTSIRIRGFLHITIDLPRPTRTAGISRAGVQILTGLLATNEHVKNSKHYFVINFVKQMGNKCPEDTVFCELFATNYNLNVSDQVQGCSLELVALGSESVVRDVASSFCRLLSSALTTMFSTSLSHKGPGAVLHTSAMVMAILRMTASCKHRQNAEYGPASTITDGLARFSDIIFPLMMPILLISRCYCQLSISSRISFSIVVSDRTNFASTIMWFGIIYHAAFQTLASKQPKFVLQHAQPVFFGICGSGSC